MPLPTSPLVALARKVLANAEAISGFIEDHGHPHRSLNRDSPTTLLPPSAPQDLLSIQLDLIDAANQVQLLATDVEDFLARQAIQNNQLACLRWLCHFRIPNLVPLKGTLLYSEVAATAKVPESDLKRIARMAMLLGFLDEPTRGQLAHSGTSAAFVTNPDLMDLALFLVNRSAPMTTKMVEATALYNSSNPEGQGIYSTTAYNIANDTNLPIFKHVATTPELREEYANYMKIQTQNRGLDIQHLVNGFDWASLGEATIVDVGGSSGNASIAIATAFPSLRFVVQDLPDSISNTKANPPQTSPSVASRIEFQSHDFFTPQPQGSVDAFLLRMIIHDWRDLEASSILRCLIPALKRGGRIIIMDTVMPTTDSVSKTQEAVLRVRDLTMMQAHNSHERELDDWIHLLNAADPALKLKIVVEPFQSLMAILAVAYEPYSQ